MDNLPKQKSLVSLITQGFILHLNFQEGLYFIRYSSFKTAYTLAIDHVALPNISL